VSREEIQRPNLLRCGFALEEIELTQIENTYDTKKHLQNCGTAN
jgi:hypothetical protein